MSRWRVAGAVVLLGLLVTGCVVWWHRVYSDIWPPDRSYIAPNIVASIVQWAIIFIVAALLYPPFRKWLKEAVDDVFHRHLEHHRQLISTQRSSELAELHAKIDHVIKHSKDVPEFQPKESP